MKLLLGLITGLVSVPILPNYNMKIVPIIFLLVFLFGFFVPSAFAGDLGLAQLSGCTGLDCSACNVVSMANGLITWLIGILFVIFALLLAIAGVKLVTSGGNHHALDEAKSSFINAIVGFMIILAAWLIVDTIMRALVGTDGNPGQIVAGGTASGYLFWSEVTCQSQVETVFNEVEQDEVEYLEAEEPDPTAVAVPGSELGGGGAGGGGGDYVAPIGTGGNSAIVRFAEAQRQRRCQYSQPLRNSCTGSPGYTDCSELVNDAYAAAGCRRIGTYTGDMIRYSAPIGSPSSLQTGDALIHRTNGAGHVVICMNNGCSQVIHAAGTNRGIIISNGSGYYSDSRYRVLRASTFCR